MNPVRVRIDGLKDVLTLGNRTPRATWALQGGKRQQAYRIEGTIDDTPFLLERKTADMFHDFDGLKGRQSVHFTVQVQDENGIWGAKSEERRFEIAPEEGDLVAKWISGDYRPCKKRRYPVDGFLKEFDLDRLPKKARLYITALGLYSFSLNGKRNDEFLLAPGSTDYGKRVQVQCYDVKGDLLVGRNRLEVELADGWFRGSIGAKGRRNTFGKRTALFLQLELSYEDGKTEAILSDGSFNWSDDGPIRFADLKDGEQVDADKFYSYSKKAKVVEERRHLSFPDNVPVRKKERFLPETMTTLGKGNYVLAFRQNLAGILAFRIHARKGQRIHLVFGELLDEKGHVSLKNIQCTYKGKKSPLQEVDYLCKEGENVYETRFAFFGYRYVEITTDVEGLRKEDFEQIALYSDFEETSSFECSNPLITRFYRNTLWSLKSNAIDIPTDCPTRERMGWTGDSQVFFKTASYLTDFESFARKHLRDVYDRQWKSGRLPQIAPFSNEDWFMWVMNGSVGWADVGILMPYWFYQKYNDRRILEEYYDGMKKYCHFMIRRCNRWGGPYSHHVPMSRENKKYFVNKGQSYGEWAEPTDVCAFVWYDFATPHPEESTAYTSFVLKTMCAIMTILGRDGDEDYAVFKEYSEGCKRAYRELVTKKGYTLDTDRQAKLVRPIALGLLTPEQENFAKKRLILAMEHYRWRLGTGFLSTPLILDVLASIDPKYAYRLLENEEMPGWLFMAKNDTGTIWESWEGTMAQQGIASLNHYSKGAMVEWLFHGMLGINILPDRRIEIRPIVGGKETFAKGTYESIYGRIESAWQRQENGTYRFIVSIPPNVKTSFFYPDGTSCKLESGENALVWKKA